MMGVLVLVSGKTKTTQTLYHYLDQEAYRKEKALLLGMFSSLIIDAGFLMLLPAVLSPKIDCVCNTEGIFFNRLGGTVGVATFEVLGMDECCGVNVLSDFFSENNFLKPASNTAPTIVNMLTMPVLTTAAPVAVAATAAFMPIAMPTAFAAPKIIGVAAPQVKVIAANAPIMTSPAAAPINAYLTQA